MFNHPVMFHHCRTKKKIRFADGSELPYDERTMQMAADYLINDMIVQAKFAGVETPPDVLHDPALITYRDSLPDAYRKLYRHSPPPPSPPKGGQGPGGQASGLAQPGSGSPPPSPGQQPSPSQPAKKGFDIVLKPGQAQAKDPTVAEQQRSDQEWRTAVKAAHNLSKVQGKLPASLARAFEDIEEPQVDWTDRVEGFFKRRLGGGRYDFRKPDRRFIVRDIFTPARSGLWRRGRGAWRRHLRAASCSNAKPLVRRDEGHPPGREAPAVGRHVVRRRCAVSTTWRTPMTSQG